MVECKLSLYSGSVPLRQLNPTHNKRPEPFLLWEKLFTNVQVDKCSNKHKFTGPKNLQEHM